MRKARILHDSDGNYFADYLNIRLDITEDIGIMMSKVADEVFAEVNKTFVAAHQSNNEKLKRYDEICKLVSQDCQHICGA